MVGRDAMIDWVGTITDLYMSIVSRQRFAQSWRASDSPDGQMLVVTVRSVIVPDGDVISLELSSPTGELLPPWDPGSHIAVQLSSGRRRHYSLCGDPGDRTCYRICIRRVADGIGSREMYALGVGESVRVRDPRNGFMFVEDGPVLFVAGGIGITPIVAMVRRARELGMDWQLVYSGRSRASMPFLDEIESWDCTRVAVLVDDGNGPPTPAELLRRAPIGGAVYCCGPESMLEAVQKNFGATSARALRVERFGMAPITDGEAFEVVLGQTGEVLQVPADRSVLDVLLERRPEIQYSCRQGFCGTCVTQVLSATPPRSAEGKDHNVDRMLTCTGRAAEGSRIVLDL